MKTPDIERILDGWLGEGTDVLPDRSVEAVLRTVERTSQRRAFRVPWRFPTMSGYFPAGHAGGCGGRRRVRRWPVHLAAAARRPSVGGQRAPIRCALLRLRPTTGANIGRSDAIAGVTAPHRAAIVNLDGTVGQRSRAAARRMGPRAVARWLAASCYARWRQALGQGGRGGFGRAGYRCRGRPEPSKVGPDRPSRRRLHGHADGTRTGLCLGWRIYVFAADGSVRSATGDDRIRSSISGRRGRPTERRICYVNSGSAASTIVRSRRRRTSGVCRPSDGKPKRVTKDDVAELQPDIARDGTRWRSGRTARSGRSDPPTVESRNVINPIDGDECRRSRRAGSRD